MFMPPLNGKLSQKDFFIYAACDTAYFAEFGRCIIRSIQKNSNVGIHIHLYNPTDDQIEFCSLQENVSFTYEHVPLDFFTEASQRWATVPTDPVQLIRYNRTLNAMSKSNDKSIQERMQRTYYACARFIRLHEITTPGNSMLAIDADAIVRSAIPPLPLTHDLYIHRITKKDPRFLAGGIYLTGNAGGYSFLSEYAKTLKQHIESNNLYWSVDQDVLEPIVPKYNFGSLPMSYIDWSMQPGSYIWTAKGKRKELAVFINEQQKYNS